MGEERARRAGCALAAALALGAAVTAPAGAEHPALAPPPAPADGCPTKLDPQRFASADELYAANAEMAGFGRRPTASRAHRRWVDRIAQRVEGLPGMEVRSLRYEVDRQLEREVRLFARAPGGERIALPPSGAVPYADVTPRAGVEGELLYVPAGESLEGRDLRGKIVVRDATVGSVPRAALAALQWFSYDPELVLTRQIASDYERDYLGVDQRVKDLRAAGEGDAAGLVLVHGFPREQVRGHYAPYEGLVWPVPAVYLGVDEGERLKQLASEGGRARLRLAADRRRAPTRTLVARVPGMSEERIVIQSHTDGMNAIWDNGPVAMLAMAEHFAALPRECRPRTLEFVFTTGHLFQHLVPPERDGGAEQYARELDREYDDGTVAMVMALEHMGAVEYEARPRDDGPGRVLEPTGRREATSFFVGESPALIGLTAEAVARHDVRETIALRGADLPGLRIPPHQNFGGEGGPYHKHLLPTIALVEGPWSLFNPAFGLEAVDRDLLHDQALLFTDVLYGASALPREALGGGYLAMRAARGLICSSALAALELARCQDVNAADAIPGLPRNLAAR